MEEYKSICININHNIKITQQDIVITDDKKKLGSIHGKVLLKHSKLIQTSHKNINNFNKKLITSVDIKDIFNYLGDIFEGYIFGKCPFKWKDVLDIINAQDIIIKFFHKSSSAKEEYLVNLIVVNAISDYFGMNKLIKFCKKVLFEFKIKEDEIFVNMRFLYMKHMHSRIDYSFIYHGYIEEKLFKDLIESINVSTRVINGSKFEYFDNDKNYIDISYEKIKPTCLQICESLIRNQVSVENIIQCFEFAFNFCNKDCDDSDDGKYRYRS